MAKPCKGPKGLQREKNSQFIKHVPQSIQINKYSKYHGDLTAFSCNRINKLWEKLENIKMQI
jgi:hypothetical protein